MFEEAIDNKAQKDVAIEESKVDEDVIEISSNEESQEDDKGPPVEFDDN